MDSLTAGRSPADTRRTQRRRHVISTPAAPRIPEAPQCPKTPPSPRPRCTESSLRGLQAVAPGQGPRHLRDRRPSHADRDDRPAERLRRRAARPDPGKGHVLTTISNFWFARTRHIVPNHLADFPLERAVPDAAERASIVDRSMVVRRLKALPVEAVVRGYLIGSGWKDYQQTARSAASRLPAGCAWPTSCRSRSSRRRRRPRRASTMRTSASRRSRRPSAPSSPRACGTPRSRSTSSPRRTHSTRGIIIADTKFEFGVDDAGTLTLIDEALTPDSSRFWPVDTYRAGIEPAVLRQAVRARLPRDARLGQDGARAAASCGSHSRDEREVPGSVAAAHRVAVSFRVGSRPPREAVRFGGYPRGAVNRSWAGAASMRRDAPRIASPKAQPTSARACSGDAANDRSAAPHGLRALAVRGIVRGRTPRTKPPWMVYGVPRTCQECEPGRPAHARSRDAAREHRRSAPPARAAG